MMPCPVAKYKANFISISVTVKDFLIFPQDFSISTAEDAR